MMSEKGSALLMRPMKARAAQSVSRTGSRWPANTATASRAAAAVATRPAAIDSGPRSRRQISVRQNDSPQITASRKIWNQSPGLIRGLGVRTEIGRGARRDGGGEEGEIRGVAGRIKKK